MSSYLLHFENLSTPNLLPTPSHHRLLLSQRNSNCPCKRKLFLFLDCGTISSAWSYSRCRPWGRWKEGCVHYSSNTKLMLRVSNQMNTLKAFRTTHPYKFLSVLFRAGWTKLSWTKNSCSLVSNDFTLVPLCLYALVFLVLPLCHPPYHLFLTHLLEEGHKEIHISLSQGRKLPECFYLSLIVSIHRSYF